MNCEIDRMMEAFVSKLIEVLGRRMVFFVGAGISIPSGVPSFRALNERVIRLTTGEKIGDEEYKFLSENLRPEVVSCQLCSVAKYKTYVCHNVVWWIGDEEICCDTFEGGAKVP